MTAVAAMAENRVIGADGGIPWHLAEDFKQFKELTNGGVLVMGRKTFESIGRPLPGRETVVVSAQGARFPGTRTVRSLEELDPKLFDRPVYLCGGEGIYADGLRFCHELRITHVSGRYQGDTWFPPFEADFEPVETVMERPEFRVVIWRPKGEARGRQRVSLGQQGNG